MKATVIIKVMEEVVSRFGDQRVTFQDGTEVGQISAEFEKDEVWFTVAPSDEAFLNSVCDSHDGNGN